MAQCFQALVRQHLPEDLPDWLKQAQDSQVPSLRGFATSLKKVLKAVTAALALPWSNGPTVEHINRLKLVKRQLKATSHNQPGRELADCSAAAPR